MTGNDPDELDVRFTEEGSGLAWGVEIEFDTGGEKSVFRSARRVILDGDCVQVQLLDGAYESYPIGRVRKILSMRAELPSSYTDGDISADEIY